MSNIFSGLVRVGSDPEIRTLPGGTQVLSFSVASSTGWGDRKRTLWLRVSYWRSPDKIVSFIKKGNQLSICGELTQNEYQANDGTTKTSLELNAHAIDLVDSSKNETFTPIPGKDKVSSDEPFDGDVPF